jgi:Phage capsid protein
MSNTQYQAYERQYEATLLHLNEIGQRPYLIDAMTPDTVQGMTKVYKDIGPLKGKKVTGRYEIADIQEPDFGARHIFIEQLYVPAAKDAGDVQKMVNDPQSDIYTEALYEINRMKTETAMKGFTATVQVNEDASGQSVFDTANRSIPVDFSGGKFGQNSGAADVGLNIDKLLEVRQKISKQERVVINTNPNNRLNIAVDEEAVQDLLASQIGEDTFPLISTINTLEARFGAAMDNINGVPTFNWFGFVFHVLPFEFFNLDSSGNKILPIWTKDSMVFATNTELETEIVKLPHTVQTTKIQVLTRVGVMRRNDQKVYTIIAKPSA